MDENLLTVTLTHLLESKVPVWCSIANAFVLGPYFFVRSFPQVWKLAPSQVLGIQQCCRVTQFQNCSSKMSSLTLHGCKVVFLHMSSHLFDKCCNSILMIESSLVSLQFRGHPRPHTNEFLIRGLSVIKCVDIKSNKFGRVERCHKMWSYTDSFCDVTFGIVVRSLMHAMCYYQQWLAC